MFVFVESAVTKVTAAHLGKEALLYVRQSTLKQVLHNIESAHRQYDLRGRAIALGWPADQIQVIDVDQGQSGASACLLTSDGAVGGFVRGCLVARSVGAVWISFV
ncbi:hypothetical protein ACIBG0_41685, partial [Nocardia sp. NPDC050630]